MCQPRALAARPEADAGRHTPQRPTTDAAPSAAAHHPMGPTMAQEPRTRLEITFEPETTTFRDEGGRFNYLCAYFVLRVGRDGLPRQVAAAADASSDGRVPLQCSLEFEDGSEVVCKSGKPALRVLGLAGEDKSAQEFGAAPVSDAASAAASAASSSSSSGGAAAVAPAEMASCDVRALRGSVRYKIMKLSRNHDGKRFCVRVQLAGVSADVVASARTRPTLVLSKRKWLKADERAPENAQRKRIEVLAAAQNLLLAREAASPRAQEHLGVGVRQLAGLPSLEEKYPRQSHAERTGKRMAAAAAKSSSSSFPCSSAARPPPASDDEAEEDDGCLDHDKNALALRSKAYLTAATTGLHGTRLASRIQQLQQQQQQLGSGGSGNRRRASTSGDTSSMVSAASDATAEVFYELDRQELAMLAPPKILGPSVPPFDGAGLSLFGEDVSMHLSMGVGFATVQREDDDARDGALLMREVRALRDQLQRSNEVAATTSARITRLEQENASLKRRLDVAGIAEPREAKCAKTQQQAQVQAKVAGMLPRTHSLSALGVDDIGMAASDAIDDWSAVFGAPAR